MKELFIVRHAKSDWSMPGQKDVDRELLPKGIHRTELMIGFLKRKQVNPDLILCSHATRAFETARLLAAGLHYPPREIRVEKSIYASNEANLMDLLYMLPEEIQSVMLVGHNPEVTNLANLFINNPLDWLPTSSVVAIRFQTGQWNELSSAPNSLLFYMYPKALH